MAVDLKEVKVNVRGILTISKDPVSIEKLRREYYNIEGMNLPYKSLGFNSDIELLQSMTDILTLPQNPNSFSTLNLIVDEKTNHLRMLVEKQKSSTQKRNRKQNYNGHCKMYNNTNNSYKNSSNSFQMNANNNYTNSFQNRNNYSKSYKNHSPDNNLRSQPSISNSIIYHNQNNSNQNEIHNSGNVTDELRAYIEYNLSHNQKFISKKKLEELIRSHKDFSVLKTENINDVFNKLEYFLDINNTGVSLKNKNKLRIKENVSLIYQESDKLRKSSNETVINQSQRNNSFKNSFTKDGFNNYDKIVNSFRRFGSYQSNDENVSSKINDHLNNVNFDDNLKIFLHKTKNIPKKVLLNIAKMFEVYNWGVNIENFKFIYNVEYDTFIDPSAYGFTTVIQMFKAFDEFIDINNEVMYTKPNYAFSMLYKCINFNDDKLTKQVNNNISMINNTLKISLNICEKSPYFKYTGKHKMVMVEAYNPSLFYLQLESNIEDLKRLMDNMLKFYEKENANYCVKPEQIILGCIYASCYTTFSDKKYWHRIKILREVNSMVVEVIHIDYGTVDNIPKTEIRFLYHTFSELPCQAMQCCLTNYNELDSIAPEVTKAFLEIIDNKPVYVLFDKYFCFKSRYKIFHVTLFKVENNSNNEGKLKNINNELTIYHLNR